MKYCSVTGCSKQSRSKGYCQKHYMQYWRTGAPQERTKKDHNRIVTKLNHAEIYLYNRQQEHVSTALVDLSDLQKVIGYRWWIDNQGYVMANADTGSVSLHRIILPQHSMIDHINRVKTDCRKKNLRPCTSLNNGANRNINKNNTSGVSGVAWHKPSNKWEARIGRNYKHITVGKYENFDDAVAARKKAERQYFGEFAPS